MRGLLIMALGLAAGPALAAEGCPQPAGTSPSVTVDLAIPAPQYRYDVGRDKLTGMMHGANDGTRHGTVLGLTVSRYDGKFVSMQTQTVRRGDIYCHYLKSVNASLGLKFLTVYVASEYKQGSCQAQIILTHENEHVRVHQAALRTYGPVVREAILKQARTGFPSRNPDADGIIKSALMPAISSALDQMQAEQRRGNGYIDTQDSYKRTAELCKKW